MSLQTMTYLVVGFTFALYIGIAIWARAGTTKDFYVAGGGVEVLGRAGPGPDRNADIEREGEADNQISHGLQ